ncbi:MAG: hypothetical protein ACP5IT_12465, partial [Thermoproteota archaeon]
PGTTNNIPAGDSVKLAATFYNQKDTTLGTKVFSTTVYALNATGLYNATSYYSSVMKKYKSYGKAPGVLSGALFQGRKVGPPAVYADFYAYVEVYAPANDLGVVVYDYFQNIKTAYSHDLPNQYVAIVREEIKDSKGNVLSPRTKLLEAWTPYNGTYGSDVSGTRKLRAVLLKSTPNNILWGFYGVEIFTANVTQSEATKPNNFVIPSENEFKAFTDYKLPNGTTIKGGTGGWIADKQVRPQWLAKYLEGATGGVDWSTGVYSLQWPAKLSITIPRLEGADVYVVDARTNYNVSVARTGKTGEASVVENVKLDTAHNPTNDPFIVPSAYALGQPVTLDLGFNLLNGTYIVKVVYQNAIVYDTFTDQPQHRYIYLGVVPPPTATGEDYDNAQTRTFPPKVAYSLMLKVIDQSPATRPLESA